MDPQLKQKKKVRILVRPWVPRRIPYQIPMSSVREVLTSARPHMQEVLYVGWVKRVVDGKRVLMYLAATGETAKEARKRFKESNDFGVNIWKLGQD